MKSPVALFLITCLMFFLQGCPKTRDHEAGEMKNIRIGLMNGPSKISMAQMMKEVGKLAQGTEISYVIKNSPDLIIVEMVKNNLDFVLLPTTSAALLYNRGIRYQVLGIPLWGTLTLSGTKEDIQNFQDLKGKTIHVMGRGMTPDIIFRYLLEKYGLQPGEDVLLDYSFPAPNELANALGAGLIDLGIVSEPHTSIISGINQDVRRIIDLTEVWNRIHDGEIPFAQTAFLVREDFGKKYPEIVRDIQDHYRKSILYLKNQPEVSAALLMGFDEFRDTRTAEECLDHLYLDYRNASGIREEISRYLEVFLRMDKIIIGNKLPDERFIYPQ